MKKITSLIFLFGMINCANAQKDTLYLLIEKPFYQYQTIKKIRIGFSINSKDKRFVCDYYKFGVINYQGWDEKGKDIYLALDQLRKEVNIDTVKYKAISSLSKDKKPWELHEELSLKKKIFLLEKKKDKLDSDDKIYDYKYFIIPLIYEGTRKNIVPTDFSSN